MEKPKVEKLKDVGGKVQTNAPSYPYFVITSLVGIKGTNRSAVLDFIILDWINKNRAELETYEITVSAWKRTRGGKEKGGRPLLKFHDLKKSGE